MRNRTMRLSAIVAAFGLIGLPASVLAEGPAQSSAPEAQSASKAQPAPKVDASDAEVKEFARIYVATAKVKQKYQQKMMQAKDKKKAKQIRSKAMDEIRGVVEDSDMSRERYSKIANATRGDKELNKRIVAEIRKQQGGKPQSSRQQSDQSGSDG